MNAGGGRLEEGWVSPQLADELPDLRLHVLELEAAPGRSPPEVRSRLEHLSNRFRGAHAVALRREPVPLAYRIFYRHVGLDPDARRTPIEAAALERLLHGAFRSQNVLDDAITLALLDTGVPIWALDADRLDGGLGLRIAEPGERLGRVERPERGALAGRIVVADARGPVAALFGDLAPGHGVGPGTRRMALFAVRVAGVPRIHAEEALWSCAETLRSG